MGSTERIGRPVLLAYFPVELLEDKDSRPHIHKHTQRRMEAALTLLEYTSSGGTGGLHSLLPGRKSLLLYRQHTCCVQKPISLGSVTHLSAFFVPPHRVEKLRGKPQQVHATRRRRADIKSDTYVLMEPGMNEEFVSEEELKIRLKGWLENWPGSTLPPDLAKFDTIDDAVSHLVRSVCEIEIDGEVGSVQWYQVQLE